MYISKFWIPFLLQIFFFHRPSCVNTDTRTCRASNSSNCSVLRTPSKPDIYPRKWQKCAGIMSLNCVHFVYNIVLL